MIKRLLYPALLFIAFPFLSKAQLYFTENKGQWDKQVLFKTEAGNSAFFLAKEGYTISMLHPDDYLQAAEYYHGHSIDPSSQNNQERISLPAKMRGHAFRVKFLGANFNTQVEKEKPVEGYENYFIGNDPSKWATQCVSYQVITYKNIYPNVDLRYYVQNDQLKYDLIVYPGADLSQIKLNYEGATGLSIRNQELVIATSVGEARELKPYTYQYKNGSREAINCRYQLSGNTVGFDVKNYDKATTLIIDPSLVFFSFSRSTGDNWGFTATPGPDGSFFGGGIASPSGFPVSPGAFQGSGGGGNGNAPPDVAIIKLSPNGRTRLFATYLGGSGLEQPHSMVCDPDGNLVVAGRTESTNFPGTYFGTNSGSYEIFVTKFNSTGTALIGSIKVGGSNEDGVNISSNRGNGPQTLLRNYGDDGRSEVILDRNNNILLASCTKSSNFHRTGQFQTNFGGQQDGVVLKINPNCNSVIWSTFLGGAGDDAAFALAVNPVNGDIYVGGGTNSSNLPGSTAGSFQPGYGGGEVDGFLSILRDQGNSVSIIRTTYFGTSFIDVIYGVQFDSRGFPYIMGTTTGLMSVVNATYSVPNAKQFIAKFQPDLTALIYRTTFGTSSGPGGAPNISPVAMLVDNCENVYVSGWGGGANTRFGNYPTAGTNGLPVTSDAIQSATDGSDFYFFVLQKNATAQLYGSFYGQRGGAGGWEHVDGGTSRFDADGVIYQAMCANCKFVNTGVPLSAPLVPTAGVFGNINPANAGGGCNLGMVKIRFDLGGVRVSLRAVGSRQVNFCLPADVEFVDTLRLAKEYIWIWGDGTQTGPTTQNPIRHTYTTAGFFDVRVVGIDVNSCNERDTALMRIRVTTDSVALNFTSQRNPPCTSLSFSFTNTSDRLSSIPPFTNRSFAWFWGDGSRNDTVPGFAPNPVQHTFPGPGTYRVGLVLIDTNFCNSADTFGVVDFQVASIIRAGFRVENGCVPYNINVTDTSFGALTYQWVSSDGQVSNSRIPAFVYNNPGTYSIKQYIFNNQSCNLVDSTVRNFTVSAPPTAGFFYSPSPSQENTPTRFTSTSSPDVVKWIWDFGDGGTSSLRDPIHQYVRPNPANNVCLVVTNAAGCTDTICNPVESIINIVNDLPSAFTPNGDGINDEFRVRGFGIVKMTLRVYNRQGLMVFESQTQNIGWDGTFKGQPQPMDAYAWTLDVEYFTGEKIRKKGDVTLIR
jgi:gliding motility-associated-like protein